MVQQSRQPGARRPQALRSPAGARGARCGAFTLVETLLVVALIALLLVILLPVLGAARAQMRSLKCSSNLRSAAFSFQLFADGQSEGGWGTSEAAGRRWFYISDFLDSAYRLDEFWDRPGLAEVDLEPARETLMCPAVSGTLKKRIGFPCSSAAIGPRANISTAVNMRLHRGVMTFGGRQVLAPGASTHLGPGILNHPYVPLLMDVNGAEAGRRGLEPFYCAPPRAGEFGPYAGGRYWIPAARHRGRVNVAFIGGHVLSSDHPESEAWDWGFQADVGN